MKLLIVLLTLACSSAFAVPNPPPLTIHFENRDRDFPKGVSEKYSAVTGGEDTEEYTKYSAFFRAVSIATAKCDSDAGRDSNTTCVFSSSDFSLEGNKIRMVVVVEAMPNSRVVKTEDSFGKHCPIKQQPFEFSDVEAYTGRALATAIKFCKNKGGDYCEMTSAQELADVGAIEECNPNRAGVRVDVVGYTVGR